MASDDGRHIMNMFLGQPLLFATRQTGVPLREILDLAGDDRPVEVVLDEAGWSSYDQARRILETVATTVGGPDALSQIGDDYDGVIGNMADIAVSLHDMGSLHALFEASTGGQSLAVTYVTTLGRRTGESSWEFANDHAPGFEPYREHCVVRGEMLRIAARFFGAFDVKIEETTCQVNGDDLCRYQLSWA
jgi:hypothetical protein